MPRQSSEGDGPSSVRTSITDIPAITSPRPSITPLRTNEYKLRNSTSFDLPTPESEDDLDIEDPLSRVYVREEVFETFSRTEVAFISASCIGIVTIPLLYLLVSRLEVREFMKVIDDSHDRSKGTLGLCLYSYCRCMECLEMTE